MQAADAFSEDTYTRRLVGGSCIDLSLWQTLDEGALTEDIRTPYLARKQAVQLYLAGTSSEVIKQLTSLGAKQAGRLIRERCSY